MLIAQYQLTANEFQPLQQASISIQLDRQKNNQSHYICENDVVPSNKHSG